MHTKIRLLLAGLFAALAVTFGVSAPAQAAYSDCSAYNEVVCFHQHADFTGTVWRQTKAQIPACRNLSADNFNDKASTVFNRTTTHVLYLYQHADCNGAELAISKGQVRAFVDGDAWWNDRVSSIYLQYVG